MKYQEIEFRPNTLCHGDCLEILQKWVTQGHKVDLIYLDPPFNSKRDYNMTFQKNPDEEFDERAQFVAFKDTWTWSTTARTRMNELTRSSYGREGRLGKIMQSMELQLGESDMLAYISYMAERLIWMREILKDTGSLYLHCDPNASHYLKTVLDGIFGRENFLNEIIWHYDGPQSPSKVKFATKHDVLLRYQRSEQVFVDTDNLYQLNLVSETELKEKYKEDSGGWFYDLPPGSYSEDSIKKLESEGRVRRTRSGKIRIKYYLLKMQGNYYRRKKIPSVWNDILSLGLAGKREKLGYPTQKPRALLERIVQASSRKGDLVLDPFCGCGTTAEASYQLKRKFIGIDILPYAVTEVCHTRLKNAKGITIQGLPTDLKSAQHLGETDPFAFEQWAISKLPGFMPNEKQVGDDGIDGKGVLLFTPQDETGEKLTRNCIAQVKLTKPSPDAIRALLSRITGGQAAIGIFITLKKLPLTPTMQKEIANAGNLTFGGVDKYPRLLFWSIEELFNNTYPPIPDRAHPITGKSMAQTELSSQTTL